METNKTHFVQILLICRYNFVMEFFSVEKIIFCQTHLVTLNCCVSQKYYIKIIVIAVRFRITYLSILKEKRRCHIETIKTSLKKWSKKEKNKHYALEFWSRRILFSYFLYKKSGSLLGVTQTIFEVIMAF